MSEAGPRDPYQNLRAANATAFVGAMDAEVEPISPEHGLGARRAELAKLAVNTLLGLLPLNAGAPAKSMFGGFAADLGNSLGNGLKAPFKAAIEDAAVRAVKACVSRTDCERALEQEMARAQADPRVQALARALAGRVSTAEETWTRLEDRLRLANVATKGELDRLAAPNLVAERRGDRGEVRSRFLSAGILDAVEERQGLEELRRGWPEQAFDIALGDAQPATPAEWDRRFAAYLETRPRAAAVFAYGLLNDPVGRATLWRRTDPAVMALVNHRRILGNASPEDLDYLDAFAMYIATVKPPRMSVSERELFIYRFRMAHLPMTKAREAELADQAREQVREQAQKTEREQRERARIEPRIR